MATTPPHGFAPEKVDVGKYIQLDSPQVMVENLHPSLAELLNLLGTLHWLLFGDALSIVSGMDGDCPQREGHYTNRAVDIRVRDLEPDAAMLWGAVIMYGCQHFSCGLFDKRQDPRGGYYHIEKFD